MDESKSPDNESARSISVDEISEVSQRGEKGSDQSPTKFNRNSIDQLRQLGFKISEEELGQMRDKIIDDIAKQDSV